MLLVLESPLNSKGPPHTGSQLDYILESPGQIAKTNETQVPSQTNLSRVFGRGI